MIVFAFDSVRNFSSLKLHVNKHHRNQISVFPEAKLFFGFDEKHFDEKNFVPYVPNNGMI